MIYSLTVAKNEEDRYLSRVLNKLSHHVDGMYVYDDRSDDNSVDIALGAGAVVRVRSDKATSFLEDESKFRADALKSMVKDMDVKLGDWILAVDADEMIISNKPLKTRVELLPLKSYSLKIHEVFSVGTIGETPYVRTDGFWGGITGVRMFIYDGDTEFVKKLMGCGAVPKKYMNSPIVEGIEILHYGYAKEEDRVSKYARYFGRPGHSVKHVDSILRRPSLQRWDGGRL
jgi:glycosyltransferase involved in cell wall biosynthesis